MFSGGIVAASFLNRGKEFTAVRFDRNGKQEYFDLSGRPLKKSFMRMPIEFARISSRFNPRRKHPVLGTVRAHKGVDYAASTGTPIMAAGDGRISFAGWQNGYGRTIIIDHGKGHTTLYAHMSRLGKYKVGSRVQQGTTIGYVGATGLASGPAGDAAVRHFARHGLVECADAEGGVADGVGKALSRAFRGAILDGRSLNSVLGEVARSFADIALKAALQPLGNLVGGLAFTGLTLYATHVRTAPKRLDSQPVNGTHIASATA